MVVWLIQRLPEESQSSVSIWMPQWILVLQEHRITRICSNVKSPLAPVSIRGRRRQGQPTPVLLPGKAHGRRSLVGCSPWGREESDTNDFTFTFHFHALEKEMATHSHVLAWRIPGTGEPGGLPSLGSHRVRHDWSDLAVAAAPASMGAGNWRIWSLKVNDETVDFDILVGFLVKNHHSSVAEGK